jgi:hypothetical protein
MYLMIQKFQMNQKFQKFHWTQLFQKIQKFRKFH